MAHSSVSKSADKNKIPWKFGWDEILLVASMFFLMLTFFVFPSSFALESAKDGVLSPLAVTLIMTGLDVVAFFGGLAFDVLRKRLGMAIRFLAPALFLVGYARLAYMGGLWGAILGAALIGFANGAGVPFLMSSASLKWGPAEATTILPLLSMELYLAQFVTPAILNAVEALLPGASHVPYLAAMMAGVALITTQAFIREPKPTGITRYATPAAEQE